MVAGGSSDGPASPGGAAGGGPATGGGAPPFGTPTAVGVGTTPPRQLTQVLDLSDPGSQPLQNHLLTVGWQRWPPDVGGQPINGTARLTEPTSQHKPLLIAMVTPFGGHLT